jgi:hypothetical protein
MIMKRSGLNLLLAFLLISSCSSGLILFGQNSGIKGYDTILVSYPKTLKFKIPQKHSYHETLTMKLFMSQALFDGKFKRKDNGKSELFLTCEMALNAIRRIDNVTLGIPKISYLGGWQYNGHDSKYPAWFEGNNAIKLPQDASPNESIKWL